MKKKMRVNGNFILHWNKSIYLHIFAIKIPITIITNSNPFIYLQSFAINMHMTIITVF